MYADSYEELANLKWCFRVGITTPDTLFWIRRAVMEKGVFKIPTKEKPIKFILDQGQEGLIILATAHGVGCAALVAQHKTALGLKTIASVSLWAATEWDLHTGIDPLTSGIIERSALGMTLCFEVIQVRP